MRWLLLVISLLVAPAVLALNVEDALSDPALEARAQNMFHAIRCVICQGETIADSPSQVAGDFRRVIRQQIVQQKTDKQITDYLLSRSGDGILMNPPLKCATWLLWFGPLLLLGVASLTVARYFRRPKALL